MTPLLDEQTSAPSAVPPERERSLRPMSRPASQPSSFPAAKPHPSRPASSLSQHGLLQSFQSLLYVLTVALFILAFIAQPFRIPSESMVPTLLVGDFLLVDKQVGAEPHFSPLAPVNSIQRGDLVVFHYPVDPSLHLVKRVVGLPGDRLHLHAGRVVINGQPLSEPYAIFNTAASDTFRDDFPRFTTADPGIDSRWWIQMRSLVHDGDLIIPAGHYFVLGDNRNNSEDSRYWGLVPATAIVGKPLLVYFSLSNAPEIGRESYAAARQSPDAAKQNGQESDTRIARWRRAFHVIR